MTAEPTVLFVDDEPGVTDGMRATMRRQPFRVLTANSAREAREILATTPVDVVVSDEQMPETPGSVLLAEVRADYPAIGRIILTGQASLEATIAAINDAAVFRFLTKPCSPPELAACIADALAARTGDDRAIDSTLRTTFGEALGGLHMAYQPIFSIATGEIVAHEALIRSNDPRLPTPLHLLDAASILGALPRLDTRVRALVAADFANDRHDTAIFVNLSPESLDDPALHRPDDPLAALAERVVIEVTERASVGDAESARRRIRSLRDRGYRIALDDLGAGYAGLTSFAALKPDIVKFDLELVRDVHRSHTRTRLIASMVELCHELGITALAEGIEAPAELERLTTLGCDLSQGYLLARPGPLRWT